MTDVWNAKADALKAAIAVDISKALDGQPISDEAVYESLMCSSLDQPFACCRSIMPVTSMKRQRRVFDSWADTPGHC